jgi:DNA-directed RNA polymerase specialized sigma24 family protein
MRSTDEIWTAVNSLLSSELLRLKLFAQVSMGVLGSKAHGRDENDLLNEALVATATGDIPWKEGPPLVAHLLGAMGTITASWSESEEAADTENWAMRARSCAEVPTAVDPEQVLQAKELLERIRWLAAKVPQASEIVDLMALGYRAEEIQMETGISSLSYREALERLRWKLQREFSECHERNFEESLSEKLVRALSIVASVGDD